LAEAIVLISLSLAKEETIEIQKKDEAKNSLIRHFIL
jgi:hypothetical protein